MISPSPTVDVILKRFEAPDEVRQFTRGRFELVTLGGMTIGRATYEPGWKWSVDVGPTVGATRCRVEHLGLLLQGKAVAAFDDGRIWELKTPPRELPNLVGRLEALQNHVDCRT